MNINKIALISILGTTIGTSALAQDSDQSANRFAKKLDLDETQKAAIAEIFSSHREAARSEIEALLNPEQLETFNSMQERRSDGNRGRRNKQGSEDSDA